MTGRAAAVVPAALSSNCNSPSSSDVDDVAITVFDETDGPSSDDTLGGQRNPRTKPWIHLVRVSGYIMSCLFVVLWVGMGYTAFARKSGEIIQALKRSNEEIAFTIAFAVVGTVSTSLPLSAVFVNVKYAQADSYKKVLRLRLASIAFLVICLLMALNSYQMTVRGTDYERLVATVIMVASLVVIIAINVGLVVFGDIRIPESVLDDTFEEERKQRRRRYTI
ncbi:unnamed protein product (mitochondrion) [Plasmodiophora brassicae]|uniref:Uncharacterized protein n=1 Tax=Plasmodiophora brassicae TaxID=37360 RepID=A0A0G4IQB4_PLABS|nr:hypothetical protein PBRA_000745 [Plasmodiophora brassicae]SPQ97711.1 unnamed protein product [Plasmodiophora brassicae]